MVSQGREPGGVGIESLSALGHIQSTPISNFFCKGYENFQKYTLDDLSGRKYKERNKEVNMQNISIVEEIPA